MEIIQSDFLAAANRMNAKRSMARRAVFTGTLFIRSLVRRMKVDSSPLQGMTDVRVPKFKIVIPTRRTPSQSHVLTPVFI
jgi:hypothetical protein